MTVANDNPNDLSISEFVTDMKRQVIKLDNMAAKIYETIPNNELRERVFLLTGKCVAAIQGVANAMRDYIKYAEELETAYKATLTE